MGNATIALAGLVAVLLKRALSKDASVHPSDWTQTLSANQQTYAALDSYASLAVYQRIYDAQSPIPVPKASLKGMDL